LFANKNNLLDVSVVDRATENGRFQNPKPAQKPSCFPSLRIVANDFVRHVEKNSLMVMLKKLLRRGMATATGSRVILPEIPKFSLDFVRLLHDDRRSKAFATKQ
jgi:hypothetical protein